ncbi:MAG: TetR/AcrR family transcriptional regulator [Flavobacteriales bacterium]|nr:TetR/AcrR family transcriptional regulator [Flavobacteriales bacterium]MBK7943326.1 TetR/AcrR family transcriptional regulator [Flavobacteriales bacterium]MBK8947969.1 TetR/AcrR family transcriptional regulator [Flavobacteriales bacterium]MBK9699984.1 TetR/AcrR family transcriptional regulator [Flavobacteriales bacterium]
MAKRRITVKGEDKRERILAKALQLFNKHGVEHVAVRDIARALGMRPGHITYYFPDKESLVLELGLGLRALNDGVVPDGSVTSLEDFFERFERILRNHIAYRSLLLSMARLLSQLPKVKAQYRATQEKRQAALRACFRSLVAAGELRALSIAEEDYLISCCSLVSRGWIPETLAAGHDLEERVPHYNALVRKLIEPFEA